MAVRIGIAIVVFTVHGGDSPAARFIEGRQIPFQYRQVIEGKGAHAGNLSIGGQQSLFVLICEADQIIQLFRSVEMLVHLTEVILSDILQHLRGLSVHHTFAGDAALCLNLVHGRLGHAHIVRKNKGAGLEFGGVRHDKVAGGEIGHILIHIKAAGEVDSYGKQHYGEGKGEDGHGRLALVSSQIGPGHGKGIDSAGSAAFRPASRPTFRVTHCFHRRNFCRHPSGPPAGEQHCDQGKQSRGGKNQRVPGGECYHAVKPGCDHRRQPSAYEPANYQTDGNTGGA